MQLDVLIYIHCEIITTIKLINIFITSAVTILCEKI
jgi:hypothetical protein